MEHDKPMPLRTAAELEDRDRKIQELRERIRQRESEEVTFTPQILEYDFNGKVWMCFWLSHSPSICNLVLVLLA